MKKDTVLVLRTCNSDLTSYNKFQWPSKGVAECPDWDEKPVCGNGLHGLLWGEGDSERLDWSADAKWLVVKVDADKIVEIDRKVKFPSGTVVCCGDRAKATAYLYEHSNSKAIHGLIYTGGYRSTLTGGYRSTLTGGDGSTLTGGDGSTLTFKIYDGNYYRIFTAYVGEDDIKKDTPYRFDWETKRFIEVQS